MFRDRRVTTQLTTQKFRLPLQKPSDCLGVPRPNPVLCMCLVALRKNLEKLSTNLACGMRKLTTCPSEPSTSVRSRESFISSGEVASTRWTGGPDPSMLTDAGALDPSDETCREYQRVVDPMYL